MGTDQQRLAAIFEEIRSTFSTHPYISARPTKGDPPEQYEVRYSLDGIFVDDTGNIQHSTDHIVSFTIPFGFPHFPPSCKPKTPIFHPDFDPSAIFLGNFWQPDRSLPELIIFIGRMITGELYSKENSFNEQAASWYRENADKLPFSKIDWNADASLTSASTAHSPAESIEIDTLEDSDFKSNFPSLGLEHEIEPVKHPVTANEKEAKHPPDVDLESIWLLSRQKRFFQLRDILKSTASEINFEGKEELIKRVEASIKEARHIHKQGEDLEHRGLPAKALEKYTAVEETVFDYPKIQEDIRRTDQAKDLLGDWVQGKDESSQAAKQYEKKNGDKPSKTQIPAGKSHSGKTVVSKRNQKRQINFVPIAIIAGILMIVVPLGFIYYSNTSHFNQAQQLYSDCIAQIQAHQFQEAAQTCDAALVLTKEVTLVGKEKSIELEGKIDTLLHSEEFRQGLAGNVFVNGKYVPIAIAESLNNSQQTMEEGDRLASQMKWEKAIDSYNLVLQAIAKTPNTDPSVRAELEQKIHRAQANLYIQRGKDAMDRNNWQQAQDHFNQALAIAATLPSAEKQTFTASLQFLINKCTFFVLKKQGDEMFAASNWNEAFSFFQQAISLGTQLEQTETKTLDSIQADAIRADLYASINEGKAAFSARQWDEAIKKYAKASKILMDNHGLLNQADMEMNQQKLARIMLQASIIKNQQEADRFIAEKKFSEAEKQLQMVVTAISNSQFAKETEFANIQQNAQLTIRDMQNEQYIREKISYLEENFQKLFSQNYPAAPPDSLTSPLVTFEKQEDGKLLFRMECTDKSRTKPLKLVMYYSYTKNSNTWAFHSNTQ